MKVVVSRRASSKKAVARSAMGGFDTETLATEENRRALARLNSSWVSSALASTTTKRTILDMDSSESKLHGGQEGARHNGHFECVCFHPLFCFNQYGDCEGALLREGNVSSADGWRELLEPIVERYRGSGIRMLFEGMRALPGRRYTSIWKVRDTSMRYGFLRTRC